MSNNSKFFSLLRTLSGDELLGFQKFLNRYHHGELAVLKVFSYCKRFHDPNMDVEKIDLASVYRKLFKAEMGDLGSDRKKLLNPLSDLHLWLKDFLMTEKLRRDTFIDHLLWLSILQEKGMNAEYSKQAVRVYEDGQGKVLDSTDACLRRIAIGLHYKQHLVANNPAPDLQAFTECVAELKASADLISLKMQCELLTAQRVRPPKEKSKPKDATLQPLRLIYQQVLALLETGQEEHYFQIESLLTKNAKRIHYDERVDVIRYLHNYAAKMVRLGHDKEWGKKVHEMDKVLLKKGVFTQQGLMSPANFNNIINAACSAADSVWAKAFIGEYSQFLPEKVREETTLLAFATVNFELKNFREVLELKEKPEFRDMHHVIRSKTLQMRSLYELNEESTELCTSFEIYLGRHRAPESDFVEATLTFVKVFKLLASKSVPKKDLTKALGDHPNMYFRSWLKEKIETYKPVVYRR